MFLGRLKSLLLLLILSIGVFSYASSEVDAAGVKKTLKRKLAFAGHGPKNRFYSKARKNTELLLGGAAAASKVKLTRGQKFIHLNKESTTLDSLLKSYIYYTLAKQDTKTLMKANGTVGAAASGAAAVAAVFTPALAAFGGGPAAASGIAAGVSGIIGFNYLSHVGRKARSRAIYRKRANDTLGAWIYRKSKELRVADPTADVGSEAMSGLLREAFSLNNFLRNTIDDVVGAGHNWPKRYRVFRDSWIDNPFPNPEKVKQRINRAEGHFRFRYRQEIDKELTSGNPFGMPSI